MLSPRPFTAAAWTCKALSVVMQWISIEVGKGPLSVRNAPPPKMVGGGAVEADGFWEHRAGPAKDLTPDHPRHDVTDPCPLVINESDHKLRRP